MQDVCTDFEVGLAEFNGETNYVHLLMNFRSNVALSP
jgi:REP-associated tyrosine transposase